MADLSVNPVASQIKPQQMSLADVMNIARGAQAYQQAQQINPLEVQQHQAAVQQAAAQASVTARAADEQKALAPILQDMANHLDDGGNPDWNYLLPKIMEVAPTTGSEYISKIATAAKGATDAKKAVVSLNQDQRIAVSQQFQQIDPNNPAPGLQAISEWSDQNPWAKPIVQQALQYHIVPALVQDQQNPNPKKPNANFNAANTRIIANVMTPAERAESMAPKGVNVNYGTGGATRNTNPFAQGVGVGETIPGTGYTQGIAPQYKISYSGVPEAAPGIGGGFIEEPGTSAPTPPVAPSFGPSTAPAATTPGQPGQPKNATGGVRPLQPFNGEPVDAYRERQKAVYKLGTDAMNDIDATKQDSASNMLEVNNRVLHLLENGKIDVGPIAQWIAGKTQGISLSADQQEIAKYLAQRTTQMSAQNKEQMGQQQTAFGNFGTNADALKEIILKDRGMLMGNQIHANGILNARGDAGNPNQNAMYQYDQNFKKMATPRLLQYISIVGDQPNAKTKFTNGEINSLRKNFTNISTSQLDDLEKQRQNLLNLTGK